MITKVTLVLAVIMAGDTPNKHTSIEVPTLEVCWAEAKDWLSQKLPQLDGAIGLAATCAVEMDGDDP